MVESLLLLVIMLVLGNTRSRKIALWLMLGYVIALSSSYVFLESSWSLRLFVNTIGLSLIFAMFSIPCYYYSNNRSEKSAVFLLTTLSLLTGFAGYFYIPTLTEFVFEYYEIIRIELIANLCLALFMQNKQGYTILYGHKIENLWRLCGFVWAYFTIKVWMYL